MIKILQFWTNKIFFSFSKKLIVSPRIAPPRGYNTFKHINLWKKILLVLKRYKFVLQADILFLLDSMSFNISFKLRTKMIVIK